MLLRLLESMTTQMSPRSCNYFCIYPSQVRDLSVLTPPALPLWWDIKINLFLDTPCIDWYCTGVSPLTITQQTPDLTGYNVYRIYRFLKTFSMIQNCPLLIFRIFRVDTKSFEAKGSPFGFFWYCETSFFFNLTEEHFYSQYFIILWAFLVLCVSFFQKLSFVEGYPHAFIADFVLRKGSFSSWKFIFWHYETFPEKNRNVFFVLAAGEIFLS